VSRVTLGDRGAALTDPKRSNITSVWLRSYLTKHEQVLIGIDPAAKRIAEPFLVPRELRAGQAKPDRGAAKNKASAEAKHHGKKHGPGTARLGRLRLEWAG